MQIYRCFLTVFTRPEKAFLKHCLKKVVIYYPLMEPCCKLERCYRCSLMRSVRGIRFKILRFKISKTLLLVDSIHDIRKLLKNYL